MTIKIWALILLSVCMYEYVDRHRTPIGETYLGSATLYTTVTLLQLIFIVCADCFMIIDVCGVLILQDVRLIYRVNKTW